MLFPKNPRQENKHLLAMARDKPCLLQIVPCADTSTTVACHSNWMEHGKGRGMKAHDFWTVWGCSRCHDALDSSQRLTADEKRVAFMAGHKRQIEAWGKLLADGDQKLRVASAAAWALNGLKQ
jgi:Protein of unknown function (DUF1364)